MKKRVFKRKKLVKVHKIRKQAGKAAVLAAAFCLLMGTALPVYGEEKASVTNIYHRHIGSSGALGGCYNTPIKHVHQGNEKKGGACYGAPVIHTHTGTAAAGGGCYVQPLCHTHQGDETQGGACYEAVTHSHTAACHLSGNCTVQYTGGALIETYEDDCFQHQRSTHEKREGIASHSSCGKGEVNVQLVYCQACGYMPTTFHSFDNIVCGMAEGAVTGYQLKCGKQAGDIEGYASGCGYKEGDTEGYRLACSKTVDGYDRDCGLSEDAPCGRLIITSRASDKGDKAVVSVRVEDLSGGRLVLSSDPFSWKDQNGNSMGSGDKLEVKENGTYQVTVKLENKDVDESGLTGSIQVESIKADVPTSKPTTAPAASPVVKPTAKPTEEPTAKPTEKPTAKPTEKPAAKPTEKPAANPTEKPAVNPTEKPAAKPTEKPAAKPTEKPAAKPTEKPAANPTEKPTAKPTEAPTAKPASAPGAEPASTPTKEPVKAPESGTSDKNGEESGTGTGENSSKENGNEEQRKEQAASAGSKSDIINQGDKEEKEKKESIAGTAAGKGGGRDNTDGKTGDNDQKKEKNVKKEIGAVQAPENKASSEIQYKVEKKKDREGIFAQPVVRVITITAGTLIFLAGCVLLLLYLRRSVKIYNDNGEGRMLYLGRCFVKLKEEGYVITITEAMIEKSCTNRYCIKPGLFRIGKKEGQELLIYKEAKKNAVCLSREMIVMM